MQWGGSNVDDESISSVDEGINRPILFEAEFHDDNGGSRNGQGV
jgi:hypothetical protein